MNSLLVTIQKSDLRYLLLFLFLLTVVGDSLNNTYFYWLIILTSVVLSVIRYQYDKKWLERAAIYIRIKIKRSYWKTGFLILVSLGFGLLYNEAMEQLENVINQTSIVTWTSAVLIISIGNYHDKFIDSIKSFDNGIQLPGRQSELIPWSEIYQFEFEERIQISSSKGEEEFQIDPDDVGFTNEMISEWKSKKGKRA